MSLSMATPIWTLGVQSVGMKNVACNRKIEDGSLLRLPVLAGTGKNVGQTRWRLGRLESAHPNAFPSAAVPLPNGAVPNGELLTTHPGEPAGTNAGLVPYPAISPVMGNGVPMKAGAWYAHMPFW